MKTRHTTTLLWIAIPICVLLRTIQIVFTIDTSRGFIEQSYHEISVLISFVIFAAVATMCVLAFCTDDIAQKSKKLQPIVAATSLLTGGVYIYEMISGLSEITGWYDILLVFLSLFSAIVFVAYGLNKVHPYKFPSLSLIIPTIYYIVKVIKLFISTSALALVTENVFLLFTNCALLWFAFEFASYENNYGDLKKRSKKTFACGITAIILGVTTSLPKLFLLFSQNAEMSKGDISYAVLMLTQTLFILSYILGNFCEGTLGTKKPASKHSA